jgi:endonuclease-3
MRGAYLLILEIKQAASIQIKSLGSVSFAPGEWVYVGSAMGNGSTSLENRLLRHFRQEKKIYWHIDYLLSAGAMITKALGIESKKHIECLLAQTLSDHDNFLPGPKGFGSSDCRRGCSTHIYHYQGQKPISTSLRKVLEKLGLSAEATKDGRL